MNKPRLDYTVRTSRAPGEQTDTWVPMIVERLQPTALQAVVEKCIDRGLIAGLKPTAAQTIAEGVAEQLAKEFSEGRSIQFGKYFYGRPYLSGTVGGDGRLTDANEINVRLYKGNGFKLTPNDFALTFADGGNNPKITSVVSKGAEPRGTIVADNAVVINGSMLWGTGDTNKVKFAEVGGTNVVEVSSFTSLSADLVTFAWDDGLESGKSYDVTVERTDANGKTLTTNAKTVKVVGEASTGPRATGYTADGDPDEAIALDGGGMSVLGTNLDGATQILFRYSEDGDAFYTGYPTEVTDTEVECSGLGYSGDVQQENGYVSVVTPNGESNRIACRYAI